MCKSSSLGVLIILCLCVEVFLFCLFIFLISPLHEHSLFFAFFPLSLPHVFFFKSNERGALSGISKVYQNLNLNVLINMMHSYLVWEKYVTIYILTLNHTGHTCEAVCGHCLSISCISLLVPV